MTNIHDTWKLKAQSSNISFHETWQKRRSSLSFELSKMSPQVGLAVPWYKDTCLMCLNVFTCSAIVLWFLLYVYVDILCADV